MSTFDAIVVQQPPGPVRQLVLLTHGVGSVPASLLGAARWFSQQDPQALVLSLASPLPADIGSGLQWFSVRGVTEENRQARVDTAMPAFVAAVRHWQGIAGTDALHTLVAGFSQGAIMALESSKLAQPPAGVVVAIAGRFANLPTQPAGTRIHLLHGEADPVMSVALARAAHTRLQALGTEATLDVAPGVGHEPHAALFGLLAQRLATRPH